MALKVATIRQSVFVRAKPDEVYDAYLDPRKHSEFTGARATCQPKIGGKFTAWDGYISGKNLVLIEGRRIVREWKTTEWPEGCPPSIIEFSFRRKEQGTELKMVHTKVPSGQVESYRQGWMITIGILSNNTLKASNLLL